MHAAESGQYSHTSSNTSVGNALCPVEINAGGLGELLKALVLVLWRPHNQRIVCQHGASAWCLVLYGVHTPYLCVVVPLAVVVVEPILPRFVLTNILVSTLNHALESFVVQVAQVAMRVEIVL